MAGLMVKRLIDLEMADLTSVYAVRENGRQSMDVHVQKSGQESIIILHTILPSLSQK